MADPAAGTPPSDIGAAIVSEQLTALVLKDEDTTTTRERSNSASSFKIPPTPPSSLESPSYLRENGENSSRRPLFSSMREALESSGQVKEEPGGYVIKRHSGHQQQFRSAESGRAKHRHTKQRSSKDSTAAPSPVEDESDAAGYTVIRRRSSCDESSLSVSTLATSSHSQTARRNPPAKPRNKKLQQQRPRRGSMSALPQSSLVTSMTPPSSSVPPGFQPRPASRVLRPPPGLTPAASGWVVKAAAPAENANKIEEPPVEALWPEIKSTSKTDSGWAVATSERDLQGQVWTGSGASTSNHKDVDDDDLLARLGVTL